MIKLDDISKEAAKRIKEVFSNQRKQLETANFTQIGFLVQWYDNVGYSFFKDKNHARIKKMYLNSEGFDDVTIITLYHR